VFVDFHCIFIAIDLRTSNFAQLQPILFQCSRFSRDPNVPRENSFENIFLGSRNPGKKIETLAKQQV
jgi:hypothetical protein